jgi:hypothetical protein
MAERFRQVHPDQIVTFNDGRELAVVSEEHFVNEVAKIASFIAFAGGTMSAVVYRQPTDLRGEMVTVGAVLSWADFTKTRAQPEPASMPPGYEESRRRRMRWSRTCRSRVTAGWGRPRCRSRRASPRRRWRARTRTRRCTRGTSTWRSRGPPPAPVMTADGEPILPRPGRDDDVDDGLSGIGGEDLSEIPEHMR